MGAVETKPDSMGESSSGFESELRISPKPVIAVLAILGVVLIVTISPLRSSSERLQLLLLGLLIQGASAIAWRLERRAPPASRWIVVATLVAVVWLASSWLGPPELLTLMGVPTALAAALIGLPAATATAAGCTVLLLVASRFIAPGGTILTGIIATWGTLGVMHAVYRPVDQVARWAWDYFERAHGLLAETRDRKAALEQALDDLAYANRQLALANERLTDLRLIAEQAQKTKTAFVAKVSHEFRTPLNMIIGLTDLLVEAPDVYGQALPPGLFEDLEIVHRNCEYLSSMINDVLDLSQAEAGRLTLRRELVDIEKVIDEVWTVVHPLLDKKALDVGVVVQDDLPRIYCDRTRIRQVILNLVSNAARFTEAGGIKIHVASPDDRVVISVSDTGPGISPEDAERVFEPFCQGASPWRDKGGSGLGLSISKQFVELHGGRIWLESELGVGTTLSFSLPVSPPAGHTVRPGHWIRGDWPWLERASRADLSEVVSTPRVVVCDETGDLHTALARFSDEIEIVGNRSLDEASAELERCPAHALILNTASPDRLWPMVVKARAAAPDTPLIGCSVPPQLGHILDAGAAGYLAKPVTRSQLEEAVRGVGRPVERILLVDDEPDVLQLWTRMLRSYDGDVSIHTALGGVEALAELRAHHPDLMLLDLVMPDVDGWQVLAVKREDETIRDIPVVLVSAQDPTEQPPRSQALLVTMGEGLSLSQVLRCSLRLSTALLEPEGALGPVPG